VTVFGVQLQLREPIDIQNVGTMDAHELRWIQCGFEVGKRLLLQISLALRSKTDVIVLSFNVIDLGRSAASEHALIACPS